MNSTMEIEEMMNDSLRISALNISTRIGIHEWEQRILQKVLLDIHIPLDLSACNNDITKTIDYAALCQCVTEYIESNSFSLIETLAENVAELIKTTFNVATLTLSVSKPHAVNNAGNICVSISR